MLSRTDRLNDVRISINREATAIAMLCSNMAPLLGSLDGPQSKPDVEAALAQIRNDIRASRARLVDVLKLTDNEEVRKLLEFLDVPFDP